MGPIRRALEEFKKGFKDANQKVKDTENSIAAMGNNVSQSMNNATAAVAKFSEKIKQAGQDMEELFKYSRLDFSGLSKGKGVTINPKEIQAELKQAEAQLRQFYQQADNLKAKISVETDPGKLSNLYNELDMVNAKIVSTEDMISKLSAQTLGFDATKEKAFSSTEIEEMQHKVMSLIDALKEAQDELSRQRSIDFGSEATAAAEQKVASLMYEYQKAMSQLGSMIDAANTKSSVSFFERLGAGAGKAFVAIKAIGTAAGAAATGLYKMYQAGSNLLKTLNPLPKIANKLGSAFKTLWSKIKTAFIFSVINSWFRGFREHVKSYLQTNAEFQNALSGFKGAALTAFQPIYEAIIPALITLISWLTAAMTALARFFAMLSGKSVGVMRANAQALNSEASAIKGAGGAAKEAMKYLAPFDELNIMNDNTGGGGGGADEESGIFFPDIEEGEEFATWGEAFSALLDKLLDKLPALNALLETFADKINIASGNLLEMFKFDGVQEKISALGSGLAETLNNFMDRVNWEQLGQSIGAGLQTAINFALNYEKTFNWHKLGESVAELFNGLIEEVDWYDLGDLIIQKWNIVWQVFDGFIHRFDWSKTGESIQQGFTGMLDNIDLASTASALSGAVAGILNTIAHFFEEGDWEHIGETIIRKLKELITNLDLESIVEAFFEALGATVGGLSRLATTLCEQIIDLIVKGWGEAQGYFQEQIEACGGNVIEGIFKGIDNAILNVKMWILEHIYMPFIKGFCDAFGIESSGETVSNAPATKTVPVGESVMEGILKGISNGFAKIGKWFSTTFQSIQTWCSTTWESIKKTADIKWEDIYDTIREKVENIRKNVVKKWEELKKNLENTTNTIKTKLTTKWEEIKTTVTQKVEEAKEEVKRKWEALKSHIITICDALGIDIDGKWQKIKETLIGIGEEIRSKISEAFEQMKGNVIGAFEGIKNGIKAPINEIIGFINRMISGVCQGINGMIGALNQINFTLPDWVPLVGGSKFNLNIGYVGAPQIPYLAKGGVITDPTVAMMGEYAGVKQNPEIVTPQSLIYETVVDANGELVSALYQMATQIISAIDGVDMTVQIGDDVIAKAAKRGSDNYRKRTGRTMFA